MVVVDDGSADKSAEIIGSFGDKRIIYIYQENQGVSAARNRGILESKGEYIAFLDSDDLWLPEKLEKQITILDNNKNVGLVHTGFDVIQENDGFYWRLSEKGKVFHRGNVFNELFMKNFVATSSVVVKRECFERCGLFDPELPPSADYDRWLHIARFYDFDFVRESLVKYRLNPAGISWNRNLALRMEAKTIQKTLRDYPELYSRLGRKVDCRLAMLYYKLGVQYVIVGRLEEGRREFLRAVRENPLLLRSYLYYLLTFVNKNVRERVLRTEAVDILRGVLS